MRPLPQVRTLQHAVEEVIESNRAEGYVPTLLIRMTQYGNAPDLQQVCERLILRGETLEAVTRALKAHPYMLTIEDFDARHGKEWGFSDDVVKVAEARVMHFDHEAGRQMYCH